MATSNESCEYSIQHAIGSVNCSIINTITSQHQNISEICSSWSPDDQCPFNIQTCAEDVTDLLLTHYNRSCLNDSVAPDPSCRPRARIALFLPPDHLWLFIVIAVVTVKVLGVLGNLIVLIATVKVREMRTPLYVSLAHLAVADTMILTLSGIIPMGEMFGRRSGFVGRNFCFASGFFQMGPSICSISMVTFISFERYIAVVHPFKARQWFKGHRITYFLIAIWLISFGVGIPYVFFVEFATKDVNCGTFDTCGIYIPDDHNWFPIYDITVLCVFRLLPVIILVILYTLMIKTLCQKSGLRRDVPGESAAKKTQAVYMMGSVAFLFVVCIVPFQMLQLITIFRREVLAQLDISSLVAFYWGSRLGAYVNSAGNPLLYAIVSADFRGKVATAYRRSSSRKFSISMSNSKEGTERRTAISTMSSRIETRN